MKFINKWYFIIWIAIIILSSIFTFSCSVGAYINAEEMIELCNVTPDEYFDMKELDSSFCPEGEQAIKSAGGCFPSLGVILFLSALYNIVYFIVYLIFREK